MHEGRDGLRAAQFVLVKSPREAQLPAALRIRRDQLELDLASLRDKKPKLPEDEYFSRIEPILVELSKTNRPISYAYAFLQPVGWL